eukprot:TRINITY_DN13780_c0_g1_i1.p1 TRINITY_DN13780_c0_g1~~TRINITY_DN13780_c0_g1_i1.p1  ORF type:complete len:262 (+),score=33.76 TRINITY_DN13780_c0_g1_i1:111-896(+)
MEKPKQMKLLTYNKNFAFARNEVNNQKEINSKTILNAIKNSEADIICLQETHQGWQNCITNMLIETHPHSKWFNDNYAAGGIAIVSKYPIKKCNLLDNNSKIEGSWFEIMLAVVETPSGDLQIGNVHLRPPINENGSASPLTMWWTSDIRKKELTMLLEKLEDIPTCILGDFNENDRYSAICYLKEKGYKDALEEYCPGVHTHWWPILKIFTLKSRLDHFIYDPSTIKAHSCEVFQDKGDGSDHFPVLTKIEILDKKNEPF